MRSCNMAQLVILHNATNNSSLHFFKSEKKSDRNINLFKMCSMPFKISCLDAEKLPMNIWDLAITIIICERYSAENHRINNTEQRYRFPMKEILISQMLKGHFNL